MPAKSGAKYPNNNYNNYKKVPNAQATVTKRKNGKNEENRKNIKKNTKINNKTNAKGKNIFKTAEKKKSVFFFNLFIASAVIICVLSALSNFIKVDQRNERLEVLEKEQNSLRIKNDSYRDRLTKSRESNNFDEDFVRDFAKAHGLRNDSEILFYLYPEE
jgi:benzoyl-CoA reductase/2-hydroxyglutaryl-CoA dehydratase subunit BcrC/BadD/HgdB